MILMLVRARPQHRPQPHRGFTLIELMVVLALTGTLMMLAAPSFVQLLADNRSAMETQDFINDLQLARSEALRRGVPVTLHALSPSLTGTAKFGEVGWRIITDKNADGKGISPTNPTDGLVLRESSAVPPGTSIERMKILTPNVYYLSDLSDKNFVTFNEQGETESKKKVYFKVCISSSFANSGRLIEVTASGLISQNIDNARCRTT